MGEINRTRECLFMGVSGIFNRDTSELSYAVLDRAGRYTVSRLTKIMNDGRQPLQRSHALH